MGKEKSNKEVLEADINNTITKDSQRVDYLKKYIIVMNTPLNELITQHVKTGKKLIAIDNIDILELNTELLIRLLLK